MEKMYVKPVEGRRCKDPASYELLPAAGKNVPKNSYWLRRLKAGDCVLVKKSALAPAPKAKKSPKAEESK